MSPTHAAGLNGRATRICCFFVPGEHRLQTGRVKTSDEVRVADVLAAASGASEGEVTRETSPATHVPKRALCNYAQDAKFSSPAHTTPPPAFRPHIATFHSLDPTASLHPFGETGMQQ